MLKEKTSIKVIARFRPLISLELTQGEPLINFLSFPSETSVSISKDSETPETFSFDRSFPPSTPQPEIFDFLGRPIIEDVLNGYNGTVFAYGQTGSGKTFTMMGQDIFDETSRGLIPRAINLIFTSLSAQSSDVEATVKCSMLEIYKENLQDLLVRGPKLRIKEDPRRGIYVDGLSEVYVICEEEVLNALAVGEKNRSIASTKMNQQSSRSHQLFMIEVSQKMVDGSVRKGTLNLVDLAGSEKISQTGATGEKLEEAKKINLSLSALGNVIHALTSHADHIPYRDSKLTRLLQESLGGNFKTSLIVNCSPHPRNIEDTLNTLKFAQRAKTIKNQAKANVTKSVEAYIKIIGQLEDELAKARKEVNSLKKVIAEHTGFGRSNTMGFESASVESLGVEMKANNQSEQINQQMSDLAAENAELRAQVEDLEKKVACEKAKRLLAEEKSLEYLNKINALETAETEKNNNYSQLVLDNKKYEGQVRYLLKVAEELSKNFAQGLERLNKGEEVNLDFLMNFDIEQLSSEIQFLPKAKIEKYFPESLRVSTFFSGRSLTDGLDIKKDLLISRINLCELNRKHLEAIWKYNILKQEYTSLYSHADLQKNLIFSLKNFIPSIQKSYSTLFNKLNAFAYHNIDNISASRLRRPLHNAVPEIFERKTTDSKEFLRRASMFHMFSNGLDSGIAASTPKDNIMLKNAENNLKSQSLLNSSLKLSCQALEDENKELRNLCESITAEKGRLAVLEECKINEILARIENFISLETKNPPDYIKGSSKAHLSATKSLECVQTVRRLNSLGTAPVSPGIHQRELNESQNSLMTLEIQPRTPLIISKDSDSPLITDSLFQSSTPKYSSRKKDKSLTSPPEVFLNIKSQLSRTFLKTQPIRLERQEGDLSPLLSELKPK